jgi:hypothetical protein
MDLAYVLHLQEDLGLFGMEFPVPKPEESHRMFGAFFLAFGGVLLMETLAGGVWHRSKMRTLIWPGALAFLGLGMFLVAILDPKDRFAHASVGTLLMFGGYIEARYRLGEIPRSTADLWVVVALLGAAAEIGIVHAHGEFLVAAAHVLLGLTAVVLVMIRLFQSLSPQSLYRSAAIGMVVMLVGVQLLAHPAAG